MYAVSLAMKHMASELNVAVFALAQLSRAVEARADKRPMMSDLKESGDLEQDADSVILLYREEYYLEKRSEEHTSETPVTNAHLVCRLLLEKKKKIRQYKHKHDN